MKKLIKSQSHNINQNHLIIFIPKTKSIIEVINQVKCVSQIADQDLSNHFFTALSSLCQSANSSLILANINMFESIAIHIDSISQAIEARVKVIQIAFTKASTSNV
jgi:hypothetical protein